MEQYIVTLKQTLKTKSMENFWSICNDNIDGDFKILREPLNKIQQLIKKDHKKYINTKFAEINILFNDVINKIDWVFSINITIYPISNNEPKFEDSWKINLKYTLKDLELHPFNVVDIKNLMKIACSKTLVTSENGILYTDFINKLKQVKNKRSCKVHAN